MVEYVQNGARLGWIVDPKRYKVKIYRQGGSVEVCDRPTSLSGEDVLPGFILHLVKNSIEHYKSIG